MFPQKIFQYIDIILGIAGNVFLWQLTIMSIKSFLYKSTFQISVPLLHFFFYNACPRYVKSRRDLLYELWGQIEN